jgi:DNA-binding MarR family transcriptional regulator
MQLYTLLKDRASINILKILYDNEFGASKKHTMQYSDMKAKLMVGESGQTLDNLEQAGLVSAEHSDGGGMVLSLTKKGKDFVEQFDKLIEVMVGKKEEQKAYQVQYSLTPLEQRILIFCSKMKSESGVVVPLKSLAQEVYPYKDPTSKSGTVSKHAKKLEELNLLKRVRNNNRTFFDVTESGERVIKEQFMSSAVVNV